MGDRLGETVFGVPGIRAFFRTLMHFGGRFRLHRLRIRGGCGVFHLIIDTFPLARLRLDGSGLLLRCDRRFPLLAPLRFLNRLGRGLQYLLDQLRLAVFDNVLYMQYFCYLPQIHKGFSCQLTGICLDFVFH